MKKVLSLILVAVLLSALVTVTASAQSVNWTDKLGYCLQQTINQSDPDDIVGASILFKDIDAEEADSRLVEATGYTRKELRQFANIQQSSIEMHDQIVRGDEVLAEMYTQHIDTLLQDLGIEDVRYRSVKKAFVIVNVPCGRISEIAQSETVLMMYDAPVLKADDGSILRYADQFRGYIAERIDPYLTERIYYDELYYHTGSNGETDWALLRAGTCTEAPWIFTTVICHRVIKMNGWDSPFSTGFGLYDAKNDTFIDVNNENMNSKAFKPTDYPGYVKAFDQYASYTAGYQDGFNRLLGDLDNDGEIAVIDVTLIQRCEAKLRDYPADDEMVYLDSSAKPNPGYFSDFNRDGERDILDATAIQRYLVNI